MGWLSHVWPETWGLAGEFQRRAGSGMGMGSSRMQSLAWLRAAELGTWSTGLLLAIDAGVETPRASQVAPAVKNPPANAEDIKRHGFNSWVGKIP